MHGTTAAQVAPTMAALAGRGRRSALKIATGRPLKVTAQEARMALYASLTVSLPSLKFLILSFSNKKAVVKTPRLRQFRPSSA